MEPVTGALEFDIFGPGMGWDRMGWDGMGWDGSCRRGSGAGSLGLKMVARLAAAGGGGWDRGSSAFDNPR